MAALFCLDHLCSVGPPGSRNTVVQRNISGPTARKWSKQSDRVTTCETLPHHAGRSASGMEWGAGTAPRRMRSAPFSPRCPPRSREQRSEPPSRERNTLPMPGGARGQTPRPARTSRPLAHSGAPGYAGCRDPRGRAPGGRSRGPARPIGMPPWSSSGSRRPSRGPQRRGLSKSVAKARVEPRCTRKNADIPHFLPWSIPARSAFATDLDTPRPGPSQEPHPHHGCVS